MTTINEFVFGHSGYIEWLRNEIDENYEHINKIPWDSEYDNFIENMLLDKYGSRIIARRFENYTTETQKKNILLTMYAKFAYNWTQLYKAYTTDYDALHNYDGTETETITLNSMKVGSGSTTQTETTTQNNSKTQTGTYKKNEMNVENNSKTQTGTYTKNEMNIENNKNDIYAFNSQSAQHATKQDNSVTNNITETPNITDTENNTVTNNITETPNITDTENNSSSLNGSSSQSDNVTQNDTTTRTLTKGGNLGVTMSQQMIEAEFEYRKLYNYFDIVLQNMADYISIRVW